MVVSNPNSAIFSPIGSRASPHPRRRLRSDLTITTFQVVFRALRPPQDPPPHPLGEHARGASSFAAQTSQIAIQTASG